MKRTNLILLALSFLIASCGASLKAIVDKDLKESYKNPLFVLPYEPYTTANFVHKVQDELDNQISLGRKTGNTITINTKSEKLSLNSDSKFESTIDSTITANKHDVVIFFKPTGMVFPTIICNL